MSLRKSKIAIIGAGIGGLAAAITLRRLGLHVDVYEQASRFIRVGAGIQMGPNAMKVLRGMGLEESLRQTSFAPRSSLNREWNTGAITNEFPLAEYAEERYGTPFLALHRGDLHAALASLVPPEVVHNNKKLTGLTQDDDGVSLTFADGLVATADAVIGADGVHSLIRGILLGAEKPRFTGRVAYRTTFPAALLNGMDIGDSRTKWWGPDRHIVIYYVTQRRDEVYFVTSQPEDSDWITPESWSAKGDLSMLREAYKGFHPDVLSVLNACPDVHKWAIFERDPLPSWSAGRVLLMGDACHPMTPYMAQGAAMALEDSVVLARCLDERADSSFPEAFRVFEATRKPRTSAVQAGSKANTWMHKETNPDWVYGYDAWEVPLVDCVSS